MTGLVATSVRRSLAAHCAVFFRDRVTPFTGVEVREEALVGALDLDAAFRELLQQPVGNAGDLRLALDDFPEHHPVAGGQLGAQHRLIHPTQRPLEPLQRPGIKCEPAPVDGLHLRGDHHMGMQLRIIQPARGLAEHCDRQALRLRVQPGAVRADPGRGPEPFDTVHHCPDCDVMTRSEAVVARQRPPHRQRLRRRQRRIEPGHRPHHTTRRRHPIHERRPQRCPTVRVPALEQGSQILSRDLTSEAEQRRLASGPVAGFFTVGLGQIPRVVGRSRHRGVRVQRRHPQHDDSHEPAGTCLSLLPRESNQKVCSISGPTR